MDPNNPIDYLSALSDDELLAAFSPYSQQDAILQQQLAMAEALRQPSGERHSTGLGAALSGLGDIAGAIGGGLAERELRGQQKNMLGQQQREAAARVAAVLRASRSPDAGGAVVAGDVGGGGIEPSMMVPEEASESAVAAQAPRTRRPQPRPARPPLTMGDIPGLAPWGPQPAPPPRPVVPFSFGDPNPARGGRRG